MKLVKGTNIHHHTISVSFIRRFDNEWKSKILDFSLMKICESILFHIPTFRDRKIIFLEKSVSKFFIISELISEGRIHSEICTFEED